MTSPAATFSRHLSTLRRTAVMLGALALLGTLAPLPATAQSAFDQVFQAVEANAAGEVRTLLARGIDPNTVDRDGNTLLALAARGGHREVFSLLLESGARPDTRNRFGETPLMYAALSGNEAIVRLMLARQVRLNPETPAWTPVHYAALRGHAGVLALLLDKGADINAISENGTTALMLAASEGRADTVAFLLKRGADHLLMNDAGKTAQSWARDGDHRRVIDLLEAARPK